MIVSSPDNRSIHNRIDRLNNISSSDIELADTLRKAANTSKKALCLALEAQKKRGITVAQISLCIEWLLWISMDNADAAVAIANVYNYKKPQHSVERMLNTQNGRFKDLLKNLPWNTK